ncbi:MAG TPA: molybdopterin-dependent oxidoreductase [Kofleriaceae bacterium]|jgi:anaerobic selenocysteine-containing dehydrogenase
MKHRICPLCEACCGLDIDGTRVAGGRATDVFSHGFICPKGAALGELHDDPDRLRRPLVKRDGVHVEVSWDEAFAACEGRLPLGDATAVVLGNPVAHKMALLLYGTKLARALGTANVFSASTLDQMPKQLAAALMFGSWLSIAVPDIERTDLLVIIGGNPMASNGSMWTVPDFRGKARALKARGGRLVVIDPRRTETAAIADRHLFVRPGGDAFLLLGVVHEVFALGAKASEHVAGVEELRAAISPFSPDAVSARCGVPADDIRWLAGELHRTPRAAVYGRIGTCTQPFGTLASWLVDVINALTGHLDTEGGAMFPKAAAFAANTMGRPGVGRGIAIGRRASRVSRAPEVYGELPLTCLAEEIETPGDGQVKTLVTLAANPVLSSPNGPRLARALDSLDFMVSVDIYRNETTRHADVIFPGLSPYEDSHYDIAFTQLSYRNAARYSPPLVDKGDRPAEWEILLRLIAIAKGAPVESNGGPEALLDAALRAGPYKLTLDALRAAPDGIDLGPLAPRLPELLRTPSGKVELSPPLLLADLARAAADLAAPVPPLVVIGRRHLRSNNSWMHNLPSLASGRFRCTALVHPTDAARLGLVAGARATMSSATGSIVVDIELSDAMMPGVVSLPHGWGHDQPDTALAVASQRPGANLNAILDENLRDPLSGNAVLGGVPITLAPA